MELRHLKYFATVAEELHFGRAAQRLQMAQPPLSQQIKHLEAELDVLLLSRTKQRVELTKAGEAFLKRTYEILNRVHLACEEAKSIDRGEAGQLIIAFTGSMAFDPLPVLLRSYQEKYPKINIVLRQMTTTEQLEALQENTIHAGLLNMPIESAAVHVEMLREEPFIVALPKAHPLASQTEPVDVACLANEHFIMTPRNEGQSYYDAIISLCQHAGFSPKKTQEARELHTALSFVASGIGVALLPSSIQFVKNDEIVYLQLKKSFTTCKIGVAWNKAETSPVVHSFISFLKKDHYSLL
ncbi:LysR family transcriptional regulator [Pseudobacillus wudalianchiensis]|uniref:LysR family transcriptional regulator n=1 Tax=Pseudobacillus wudalianchiensis TaxID=1743143 RepID=A0A1B9ADY5_9BACI|nr:LysR family transcriptional regulator [Bacillus wudalianchiensis]OCA82040.1 LysR family transcriptional regulator [Bacillus wudalianchiensis]